MTTKIFKFNNVDSNNKRDFAIEMDINKEFITQIHKDFIAEQDSYDFEKDKYKFRPFLKDFENLKDPYDKLIQSYPTKIEIEKKDKLAAEFSQRNKELRLFGAMYKRYKDYFKDKFKDTSDIDDFIKKIKNLRLISVEIQEEKQKYEF